MLTCNAPWVLLGDVNEDGKIDVTDLSVMAIHLADNIPLGSETAEEAADVDKNCKFNLADLARLRQFISKVIEKF